MRSGRIVRSFVVITADAGDSEVVDAITGETIAAVSFYLEAAANGFVAVDAADTGSFDTVAYDLGGQELWRIAHRDARGIEIVDKGAITARTDTVELTFYD